METYEEIKSLLDKGEISFRDYEMWEIYSPILPRLEKCLIEEIQCQIDSKIIYPS